MEQLTLEQKIFCYERTLKQLMIKNNTNNSYPYICLLLSDELDRFTPTKYMNGEQVLSFFPEFLKYKPYARTECCDAWWKPTNIKKRIEIITEIIAELKQPK